MGEINLQVNESKRLIVAISGARGVLYGIRLLEILRTDPAIETHLVLTNAAKVTIVQETRWKISDVEAPPDLSILVSGG